MNQNREHRTSPPRLDRRGFLAAAGALGLHGLLASSAGLLTPRAAGAESGQTVAREAWGRIDKLGENLWSVISDPLGGNFLTVCNGGIVAGQDRVLVFEAFIGSEGAGWVAEQAKELTGRWPTDVVISHYHGDHVNGLAGFQRGSEGPRVWVTEHTRKRAIATAAERNRTDETRRSMLEGADALKTDGPTRVDLGGRVVTLHPRSGHTASDVTVELEDPSTVFWGDLLWVGMFPNYRDATPSQLAATVRETAGAGVEHHITGHGPVASAESIRTYLGLLEHVEEAAERAHGKGQSAAEAAKAYQLPESTKDWHVFQDTFFEAAFTAWYRELGEPDTAVESKG